MKTRNIFRVTVAAAAALFAGTIASNAGVVINFTQDGANVVATASGSMKIPTLYSINTSNALSGGGDRLFFGDNEVNDTASATNVGTISRSGLNLAPSSAIGQSFGYSIATLYWDVDNGVSGDVYTPVVTWTWLNKTISEVVTPPGTETLYTVWQGGYAADSTIAFSVVPETSSSMLVAGAVGLFLFRRRK